MKKLSRILTTLVTITSLSLAPMAVHAQVEEVTPDPTVTNLPATGATPEAPDTGISPSNKPAQTVAVFIGGSVLGAALGLGIVTLRKKKLEQ